MTIFTQKYIDASWDDTRCRMEGRYSAKLIKSGINAFDALFWSYSPLTSSVHQGVECSQARRQTFTINGNVTDVFSLIQRPVGVRYVSPLLELPKTEIFSLHIVTSTFRPSKLVHFSTN
jgi:hypothetical protein